MIEDCSLIKINKIECLGFPAYKINNETIEVVVVPEIGGRIMGFGFLDNNILFQNQTLYKKKPSVYGKDLLEIKRQRIEIGYMLYGGEKTWIAPQESWEGPPYVDLDFGVYEINIFRKQETDEVIIELESSVCRETKIKIKKSITIPSKGNKISITQRIENHSSEALTKGIWQVTMVNRPAIVTFPCDGNSQFKDGIKSFDKTDCRERLVKIHKESAYITCEDATRFKFGTDINHGYVDTHIVGTNMVFKKEFEVTEGPYGHQCAIEVYNNPGVHEYLEVEVHSPLQIIEPGEYSEYKVSWSMERKIKDNILSDLNAGEIKIEIKNKSNTITSEITGKKQISLILQEKYKVGDKICFTNLTGNKYLVVNIENELSEALIYVPGNTLEFNIPFGDDSIPYAPNVFNGSAHTINMRIAREEEIYGYRNLAKNVMDQRGTTTYYPHATANVETRNEAVFAARNTIDGQTDNQGHGIWPFESWGTWQREDAELIVDFGREVEVNKIALYLRADFPHDTYWNALTIVFSDGTKKDVEPIKTSNAQYIEFDKKIIKWIKLTNFKMANEPAEFAALTEIQVYGIDIKGI